MADAQDVIAERIARREFYEHAEDLAGALCHVLEHVESSDLEPPPSRPYLFSNAHEALREWQRLADA